MRGGGARALRRTLARALGVTRPDDAALWLVRLFVLPPSQSKPLPRWLSAPLLRARSAVAHKLGVADPERVDEWLIRLLILPDHDRRTRHWVPAPLVQLVAGAIWLLTLPYQLLTRAMAHLNFDAAGQRMDGMSRRVLALPPPIRMLLLAVAVVLLWMATTTPLNTAQQLLFFAAIWISALLVQRMPGNLAALLLVMLSLVASGRYIWWRLTQSLGFETPLEHVFGYGLLLAEIYTWLIMLLGYIQNAWPLHRQPAPLPEDRTLWPTVDVFVPTYNEPLRVVKPTLYAALAMDWPKDKLRVWLLDDGRREEFREFCGQIGAGYLTRNDNAHAKAGNLNRALEKTDGEFVAIFDCDHVPVRSFLVNTLGWFLRDPKCAMLQTPHHFFSPDPFERNLGTFRRVPNEGSLFYGLVQDGNDLWNATFFCGSCAVIRRKPLEEVGGIAVETVTEDAHTALKMHRLGYTTAYLNLVQAAGLATETLSGHIGQRIRWARGMAQIFRIDNPMLGRGLNLFQRLCYSNGMLHFFNGIPRLVYLTAPLAYLYFELHVIYAAAASIVAYALPHLFLSGLTNSRIQGRYRHSYWAEVYESVLAWYITLPTTIAFINPRHGKFNVTVKGGLIERSHFDYEIARPYLGLILLNVGGLIMGFWRLFHGEASDIGTVLITMAWAFYNFVMLGAAVSVATETRQVRKAHRVPVRINATLLLADGQRLDVTTDDFSTTGLGFQLHADLALNLGDAVTVILRDDQGEHSFPARVRRWRAPSLAVNFEPLTLEQESRLVSCTFGWPEAWLHWDDESYQDRPLKSFLKVLRYGLQGYVRLADRAAASLERALRGDDRQSVN